LAEGDFHLTNWISNSPTVVASLQPKKAQETAPTCDLAADEVQGENKQWWQRWFKTLITLNNVRTRRNLQQDKTNIVRSQLHIFCDASEEIFSGSLSEKCVQERHGQNTAGNGKYEASTTEISLFQSSS
jgi:hypothetical protein